MARTLKISIHPLIMYRYLFDQNRVQVNIYIRLFLISLQQTRSDEKLQKKLKDGASMQIPHR